MICYSFLSFVFFITSYITIYSKNNTKKVENINNNKVTYETKIEKKDEKNVNNLDNKINNNTNFEKSIEVLKRDNKELNKNNNDKTDLKNIDELLKFDEDDDFKDIFGDDNILFFNNAQINNFANIPVSLSFYLTLINYNLGCIKKSEKNEFFRRNIFNINYSILLSYKFTTLHKKMWNSFLNKKPNNKVLTYIRDHFIPKLGLFFEKGVYNNYYSYKIKAYKETNSDFKDFETKVGIPLLRLGPTIQLTWLKDEAGMINASFMFSAGWQSNIYTRGCCCFHNKDIWLYVNSDFTGINTIGVNTYAKKIQNFNLRNYYIMFHLEFGFYFLKLFTRFYSPISKSNDTSFKFLEMFNDEGCEIKDAKNNNETKDMSKKLNFDKWTMSWGISLSL